MKFDFYQPTNNWRKILTVWIQCDLIGRFLKDLGNKFTLQSSQNFWWLWGYFEKRDFSILNFSEFFLFNHWKNWATFNFNMMGYWRQAAVIITAPVEANFKISRQVDDRVTCTELDRMVLGKTDNITRLRSSQKLFLVHSSDLE